MVGTFVQDLAVVAGVAGITAAVARWIGLPTLVGYLAAGLVVGPYLPIPLFADPERVRAMAEFGVILVMFGVGLEFRLARLLATLPRAGPATLFEVGALAWLGWTAGRWLGFDGVGPVFLGAALAISSTMVVDRVTDGAQLEPRVRDFVFGVLVVQDVVAIVLVAALSTLAGGESPSAGAVVVLLAKLCGALLAMFVAGWLTVPVVLRRVVALGSPEATLVTTAGVGFGFAAIAAALGYSAALGAFLGGVLVAESGVEERVAPMLRPLRDLFAAVFFVSIGMEVDPWVAARHLPTIAALSAVVIAGQLGAVTFAGVLSGNGLRTSVFAGLLLGQVGEFGFLLAGLGVAAGAGPELTAVV
ncbi:MAG: cation:proton antiporter, partial [Myxococcota bacterium]